jgi:phosphoglycolate phosphatase
MKRDATTNRSGRYAHIFWDWNGTLFDDAWLAVSILNNVLKRRNMPAISEERYRDEFVTPVRQLYVRLEFDLARDRYEDLADEWFSEYEARRFECRLHADAESVLSACSAAGCPQSILSMYPQRSLDEMVDHYRVRRHFSRSIGLDDHFADGKLELGTRLLGELEGAASEVVLIGDTVHDYEVARQLGMACILIPRGHQSRRKLESCGATMANGLAGIPALVL